MAKKKDFDSEIFTEWCQTAFRFLLREHPAFDLTGESQREIERKIERANRFEEKLDALCTRFHFNIQKARLENYEGVSDELSLATDCETGDLDRGVAEFLVFAFKRSQESRKSLKMDLSISKAVKRTSGAKRLPASFAEIILVGFELHSESDRLLEKFRKFISPKGGLERHLSRSDVVFGDDASLFVCRDGEKLKDLRIWEDRARQKYERIVLSHELGFDVKSFAKCGSARSKLKKRVADRAAEISEKIRRRRPKLSPS